jgi:WD40 repeat protein
VLAVGHSDGTVGLYATASGRRTGSLVAQGGAIDALAASPSGALLAAGTDSGNTELFQVSTGQLALTLPGHTAPVRGIAFSSDGGTLYTVGADRRLITFDLSGRRQLGTQLRPPGGPPLDWFSLTARGASAIGLGPLGAAHVGLGAGSTITLSPRGTIAGALSPDGRYLAAGDADGGVRLVNTSTHRASATLRSGGDNLSQAATDVAFSPNGGQLAAVVDEDISPDGSHVVPGGPGLCLVWDLAHPQRAPRTFPVLRHPGQVVWSPDGTRIAVTSYLGPQLAIYQAGTGRHLWTSNREPHSDVTAVAWTPDGRYVVDGTDLGHIELRRADNGALAAPGWDDSTQTVQSIAVNPAGTLVAAGASDGSVVLRHLPDGAEVGAPLAPAQGMSAFVAFGAAGRLWVAAANGGVWRYDLGLGSWLARACHVAGSTLSRADWAALDTGQPYVQACG